MIKIYNDKSRAIEEVIYEKSYDSLEQNPLHTYSLSAFTEKMLQNEVRYPHNTAVYRYWLLLTLKG